MSTPLRRGLPRRPGGEPWPPAGLAPSVPAAAPDAPGAAAGRAPDAGAHSAPPAPPSAAPTTLRRGLPRAPGGEPWPQAGVASAGVAPAAPELGPAVAEPAAPVAPAVADDGPPVANEIADEGPALRRGLPREPGGEPWPPAGRAPAPAVREAPPAPPPPVDVPPASAVAASVDPPASGIAASVDAPAPASAETPASGAVDASGIADAPASGADTRAAAAPAEPLASAPARTLGRAARWALLVGGIVVFVAVAVLAARWLRTLEPVQAFLVDYPGEVPLPEGAPVGFPAWLAWQHFCNVFLMVLIVRSGLQVRRERRPAAYWSSRRRAGRKMSLNAWFHQSLDVLWLVNGIVFVVLLAATGQWMRIVPTDWAVVPNAASALLQYVSLDWPVEHGWTNYNSLQQLAYFATVFLAAPLAAITGVRMSPWWPARAERLNRAYPIRLARAVHFPVMLYFVAFVVVHVGLVFSTGALRNLNHMYGGQDAVNWVGFGVFCVSLLVIAAAWIAARPVVLAPVAGVFGTVSRR